MRPRILALVDGEHYPPVVRAALQRAGEQAEVVAALLLGGREKLSGEPDYGVPLERVGGDGVAAAMVDAARRHGASRVLDLSDEPVLDEGQRVGLIAHALAAGVEYTGPDFHFSPPSRSRIAVPTLAVIGSGKRVGKTAVSGHAARVLHAAGHDVVVVAMGRGGHRDPELVHGGERPIGVQDLLERAHAGQHAASDFLEDAALARVTTVGARRCGGGLLGVPYISNVEQAAQMAAALSPDLVLLEGSGAAVPPVSADRTVLVHPATSGAPGSGFQRYRLLLADLVVLTMCERPYAEPSAWQDVSVDVPLVRTVLRPHPVAPVAGRRVAFFTTAQTPEALLPHLAERHDAEVVAVSGALSDRDRLRADLDTAAVRTAEIYLVEIKAAAIDVVAEAARRRGAEVVFCDNRPQPLEGEPDLDRALVDLAGEVMAVHG